MTREPPPPSRTPTGPPRDEDPDRRAILLRRAAFLATAFASLTAARTAHAAGDEVPCPRDPTDASREQEAKAAERLLEDARAATPPMDLFEQALRTEEIYALAPTEARVVVTMEILLAAKDPDRAYRLGEMYQVCRPPSAEVRRRLDDIASRFARVALVPSTSGDYRPTRIAVSGRMITFARFLEGAYVDPGATEVGIVLADGRLQAVPIAARAGELLRVTLPTLYLVSPMPCLSPLPPPTIEEMRLRLGAEIGAGPTFLPDDPLVIAPTFGPRIALDYRLGEGFRLESAVQLRFAWMPSSPEHQDVEIATILGTEASILGYPTDKIGFGAGMCAGYVFVPDDPAIYLKPSPYIGFVATPFALRSGLFGATLRVPFALADTSVDGARAIRVAWIAPEVSASFWFDLISVQREGE